MCPDVDVRDTCVLICKPGCEVAVPDARDEHPSHVFYVETYIRNQIVVYTSHLKQPRKRSSCFLRAYGIDAGIERTIIFVYPLTGCIHCNRISSVAASGGGGGDGALFIAVTRFLAASFTEFFHSELPLSVELSAQAPVNIFDHIKSYRNEC